MSVNKLPPENQRALEILLKPGMKEYMKECARKGIDKAKLKKWLEDGAPYEEDDEISGIFSHLTSKLERFKTSVKFKLYLSNFFSLP